MAYINYRNIEQLNNVLIYSLHKIPHDIDLVVGIPRSGMLPANLIALYLNKPFTDLDSFIEGKIYSSGERGKNIDTKIIKKVLVVDDSISSGNALNKAKNKLKPVISNFEFLYGVIFATTESASKVDFYCEIIDGIRLFQWNIFHHGIIESSCLDMDGVLCVDPPIDDDGEKYIDYISNATPLFIPKVKIGSIVTCRLEKYRIITEKWLEDNGIQYNELLMLPFANKRERIEWGKHGEYKGLEYKKRPKSGLFIESSIEQALKISRISHKPVFCVENFRMYNDTRSTVREQIKKSLPHKVLSLIRYFRHI